MIIISFSSLSLLLTSIQEFRVVYSWWRCSGYDIDAKLVVSLRKILGETYNVYYNRMLVKDKPDFGWCQQIGDEIITIKEDVILWDTPWMLHFC